MATAANIVMHTCNSSTWGAKTVDHEFEASLDYVVRVYLKNERMKERGKEEGRKEGRGSNFLSVHLGVCS
jgi:hypothetical protein